MWREMDREMIWEWNGKKGIYPMVRGRPPTTSWSSRVRTWRHVRMLAAELTSGRRTCSCLSTDRLVTVMDAW